MPDVLVSMLKAHQEVYERTDGWLGHRLFFGMPSLLLRTVGRRTGKTRTSALLYGRDADSYLVVASNGGAAKPPAWFHNLVTHPECEIQIGRTKRKALASVVWPDDRDYPRIWDIVNKVNHDQYRGYQEKTDRPIPVFAITPID